MPTAPRQSGSALQEFICPLPPGNEAVHCKSSTAHCPEVVRQCVAKVALPTASIQRGSALQESHCPPPPGGGAVQCGNCPAHCPQAVR